MNHITLKKPNRHSYILESWYNIKKRLHAGKEGPWKNILKNVKVDQQIDEGKLIKISAGSFVSMIYAITCNSLFSEFSSFTWVLKQI